MLLPSLSVTMISVYASCAEKGKCKICVVCVTGRVAGQRRRKCKMCVRNREGGVGGVAEGRKCKMCVCNRG